MDGGPINVLVQFCGSCGYRNLFNQVQQHLVANGQGRLGDIQGELYPTPLGTAMLSQLLSYTFMVGLFLMMVGEWFFTSVVNSEPARKFVRLLKDNQLPTMLVLMACNMASTRLLANGAFEVYFNDELVFSKLDTGLVPDGNYLMERFKNFQVADTIGDY